MAARKFYEEYLIKGNGDIIFAYLSGESNDPAVGRFEARYYWENDQLAHQQLKGDEMESETGAFDQAQRLKEAFVYLMH